MSSTNLSKIAPKLRTQGAVTGNFGRVKVKSGSTLRDLGVTKAEVVRVAPRREYVQRMIVAWRSAPSKSLREFAYKELCRLNCFEEVRYVAPERTTQPFKGPPGSS